ncbi:MAG TPA: hypothetical protein VEX86_11100, partial [Longimicrobium sp.]|nr:hypothetical protein [Longimicrobium sp.]
ISTVFEASDPGLLHAALGAYGAWPADAASIEPPLLRIRLDLDVALDAAEGGDALDVRVDGGRLAMRGAGVEGGADAARGEAWCTLSRSLAEDPRRLAAEVLDTLLLFLLTRAGRVPLHASGVVVGGTAAVLAGPSGTGKSTLALAALGAGLPVLSDDTVYVQLRPRLRVWGFPRPIHVFPDDALAGAGGAARLRSGRWKTAVPLPPGGSLAAHCAALFLLERGDRVALHPLGADEAVARMTTLLEPGFDHFADQLAAAVRAVAAGGAWRLTLSADPADAIRLVRDTLEAAAER